VRYDTDHTTACKEVDFNLCDIVGSNG
jgi:hypothetical protein